MRLEALGPRIAVQLPVQTILYRVQRIASPGALPIGPLLLPPPGLMLNRFDLVATDVGYFAESPETAVYQTLARGDASVLSVAGKVAPRQLLQLRTTKQLRLLNLRPRARRWPVLQSLRYANCRMLAASAQAAGYEGLIYRSAQQHGADCYAIFDAPLLLTLGLVRFAPLNSAAGALHLAVADAVRGSQVPLVP